MSNPILDYYLYRDIQRQFKKSPGLPVLLLLLLLFPLMLPAFFFMCFLAYSAFAPSLDPYPYHDVRGKAMEMDVSQQTMIDHLDCLQNLKKNQEKDVSVCDIPADAPSFYSFLSVDE